MGWNAETLDSISPALGELTNLRRLRIHNAAITRLPDVFDNLKNLESVSVSNTWLYNVPQSLIDLSNTKSDLKIHFQANSLCILTDEETAFMDRHMGTDWFADEKCVF